MKFVPHEYQRHAIQFILDHPQAAILLGMGLGKSVITLTALDTLLRDSFEVHKALIVAPLRVARDTWPAELAKWDHLSGLTMSVIVGTAADRKAALATPADIYVINRENIPWLVDEVTPEEWPFDMVVIDELSSFKNHQAKRFKKLLKCRHRMSRIIGLTGTPAPNSLLDIWAPFRLIDGGHRLGRFITNYRTTYFDPDKRNGMRVFTWRLKPGAEEAIYGQISGITLSMRTCDYLRLPGVTYSDRVVKLTPAQARQYKRFKRDMVLELGEDTLDAANAATLSGKLLQLASGAIYTEDGEGFHTLHEAKLDALEEVLESAQGEPVLLAYWFKHERERILDRFPQARVLDTGEDFEAWCAGKVPLGLIHPASAGHGLNLQSGGHIMCWFTTPWSLELYEQANARLYRQGQTQPVSIVHLRVADTIDDDITRALTAKAMTQDNLVKAVSQHIERN